MILGEGRDNADCFCTRFVTQTYATQECERAPSWPHIVRKHAFMQLPTCRVNKQRTCRKSRRGAAMVSRQWPELHAHGIWTREARRKKLVPVGLRPPAVPGCSGMS
jgi:hypothetical protein